MKQYRILKKKDGKYYPQVKGWWRIWSYFLNDNGNFKWFYYLSECEAFLERETAGTQVISWEPKCKS